MTGPYRASVVMSRAGSHIYRTVCASCGTVDNLIIRAYLDRMVEEIVCQRCYDRLRRLERSQRIAHLARRLNA